MDRNTNVLVVDDNPSFTIEDILSGKKPDSEFNLNQEIMAIRVMDSAYGDYIKSNTKHPQYIPAGKPWAECQVASSIFFKYFNRRITEMNLTNFVKESSSIKKNLAKAISEQYIPESSAKILSQYLDRKTESYFLEKSMNDHIEDKRRRHDLRIRAGHQR